MNERNSLLSGQIGGPPLALGGGGAPGRGVGGPSLGGVAPCQVPTTAGPGMPGACGVVADPAELPGGCGIVFATKGPQLDECVATVTAGQGRAGRQARWVAGLQNGGIQDDG